jgi:hypothetical protein
MSIAIAPEMKNDSPSKATYSISDIARLLDCSLSHAIRLSGRGLIPGRVEAGRILRFGRGPVDAWLAGEQPR